MTTVTATAFLTSLVLALSVADHVQAGWIDPDSPHHVHTTRALYKNDQRAFHLVFSDEFAQNGRTFQDGADPRWTALDKNDVTNNPLHYYSSHNARTSNGKLDISTDLNTKTFQVYDHVTRTMVNQTKEVRSGMLQSWNKFCFTGGIVEYSARLPGNPYTGGLWPAIWMMGNLARATYVNSTEKTWPFSTNICDDRNRKSQEISACKSDRGRGAPEVDLLEVMYISQINASMLSSSLQVAPGLAEGRPLLGETPNKTWYQPELGDGAGLNNYFYGVHVTHETDPNDMYEFQTDTISVNYWLSDSFWTQQHLFRIEWEPPLDDGSGGYIYWFIDGKLVAGIEGKELQRVSQTEIPSEPMYLLMNLAVSKDWSFPDAWFLGCQHKCWSCFDPNCQCALPDGYCETFPAHFEIDYVRVFQATRDPRHTVGCSPAARPTADFIQQHKDCYMVDNQTDPLLPVMQGGASCTSNKDCGHGHCVASTRTRGTDSKICRCHKSWTGPTCLAYPGNNNTAYDGRTIGLLAFLFFLLIGSALLFLGYVLWNRRYSERVLYHLLSDIKSEKSFQRKRTPPDSSSSSESFALKPKDQSDELRSYQKGGESEYGQIVLLS